MRLLHHHIIEPYNMDNRHESGINELELSSGFLRVNQKDIKERYYVVRTVYCSHES